MIEAQRREEGRVYQTLAGFRDSMVEEGMKGSSVQDYMTVAKVYLVDQDVNIPNEKFRRRVRLPVKIPINDKLLEEKEIIQLLDQAPDKRMRALILLLTSSGMRLQEALTLRVRQLTLDDQPRAILNAKQTKNSKTREVWMSRQAAAAIKALKRSEDQYVFDFIEPKNKNWVPDPDSKQVKAVGSVEGYRAYMAEKKAIQMLRRLAKRVSLDDKIEGHNWYNVRFHAFRKYAFTMALRYVGESFGHALLGHKGYMNTYDLSPTEQLREIYFTKLEPHLTVGETSRSSEDLEQLKKQYEEYKIQTEEWQRAIQASTEEAMKGIRKIENILSKDLKSQYPELKDKSDEEIVALFASKRMRALSRREIMEEEIKNMSQEEREALLKKYLSENK